MAIDPELKEIKEELDVVDKDKWMIVLDKELGIDWTKYKDKDTRLLCVDLKLRGMPNARIYPIYKAINTQKGVDVMVKENFYEWLESHTPKIDVAELEVYAAYRKDMFNKLEHNILNKLENKLAGMDIHGVDKNGRDVTSIKDIIYAFDKIVDKRRLEEDKATSKVDSTHSVMLDSLVKRRLQGEGKIVDI